MRSRVVTITFSASAGMKQKQKLVLAFTHHIVSSPPPFALALLLF